MHFPNLKSRFPKLKSREKKIGKKVGIVLSKNYYPSISRINKKLIEFNKQVLLNFLIFLLIIFKEYLIKNFKKICVKLNIEEK